MRLHSITIQFESPEEQKEVMTRVPLCIDDMETWNPESGYTCWTTFIIEGCTPDDIVKYFGELNND